MRLLTDIRNGLSHDTSTTTFQDGAKRLLKGKTKLNDCKAMLQIFLGIDANNDDYM